MVEASAGGDPCKTCVLLEGTNLLNLLGILCNGNFMEKLLKYGEEAGFKLIFLPKDWCAPGAIS